MLRKNKPLTKEEFKAVLPTKFKGMLPKETMKNINDIITGDTAIKEAFRDNLIGYVHILKEGKFTINQYINAVKYVCYKLMGAKNQEAWARTFPHKMARLVSMGTSEKDIAAHVAIYNKSKLVNLIYEQTIIPTHVYNADIYQQAVLEQARIMLTAKSDKTRSDAAHSLMTQLAPPAVSKIQLDISNTADATLDALKESTLKLVAAQKAALESGTVTIEQIAHSPVVANTVEEEDEEEYTDVELDDDTE